jgi:hypothetical protein
MRTRWAPKPDVWSPSFKVWRKRGGNDTGISRILESCTHDLTILRQKHNQYRIQRLAHYAKICNTQGPELPRTGDAIGQGKKELLTKLVYVQGKLVS